MSSSLPNAEHSQPQSFPPSPGLPDFTELASLIEKLEEAAKRLAAFCQQSQQAENPSAEPNGRDADEESTRPEPAACETRCYRLPGYILDAEREMLEFWKAEDWQELFNKAHDQIYATVLLMERVPAEEKIDGFSIALIVESLMVPLRMLSNLCSLIADFRLVSVMKVA
jgi:hypothetical protein